MVGGKRVKGGGEREQSGGELLLSSLDLLATWSSWVGPEAEEERWDRRGFRGDGGIWVSTE